MSEQELTLPQRVQQLEEADERLTEIVNNLLEETLSFQMVIKTLLQLNPPMTNHAKLLDEIGKRFSLTLGGNPRLATKVELLIAELFPN